LHPQRKKTVFGQKKLLLKMSNLSAN
jgi:hypothetical protein